jgi:probable rRNA maturation factor
MPRRLPHLTAQVPFALAAEAEPDPEPDQQRLIVDVLHDFDGWSTIAGIEPLIAAATAALQAEVDLGPHHATVALMLSSDAEVRQLNAKWRGIDKATNVLSFPAPLAPGDLQQVECLGDIALACETVLVEAADLGIAPAHHLQHLVVHGLLHLLGYDHETDVGATEMEGLEVDILARLGIPSPYAGSDVVGGNT